MQKSAIIYPKNTIDENDRNDNKDSDKPLESNNNNNNNNNNEKLATKMSLPSL
jgi:hypothetical protein